MSTLCTSTYLAEVLSFPLHYQGNIDFNTGNTNCPMGMFIRKYYPEGVYWEILSVGSVSRNAVLRECIKNTLPRECISKYCFPLLCM